MHKGVVTTNAAECTHSARAALALNCSYCAPRLLERFPGFVAGDKTAQQLDASPCKLLNH